MELIKNTVNNNEEVLKIIYSKFYDKLKSKYNDS